MKSHLSIVGPNSWANWDWFKKCFPTPVLWRELPIFSSSSFSVSCFRFRSFVYLELIFVQGDIYGSNFNIMQVDIQFSQCHLLKMIYLLQHIFWHLSQILSNWSYMYLYFGSLILFHSPACLFSANTYCFPYYDSVMCLKIWNSNTLQQWSFWSVFWLSGVLCGSTLILW